MESFIVVLIVCAVWATAASIMIASNLMNRGISVSFFWLKFKILGYVHQYRKITKEETGRVGPLFYHYVIPLIIALLVVVGMVIVEMS